MKYLVVVLVAFFFSQLSVAEQYSDLLAKKEVKHLELVLNNLNMFLMSKSDEIFNQKRKNSSIEDTYIKFYLTKDNTLAVDSMHEAPVAMVTKAQCNTLLDEGINFITGENSSFPKLISAVSFHDFKLEDAKEFVDNTHMVIYLRAKENAELLVKCQSR